MAQIEQNYENKAVAPQVMKPPRKRPGGTKNKAAAQEKYTLVSPRGNQYNVEADKLDFFKHIHSVDDSWTIS